jgi:hypothetical protein
VRFEIAQSDLHAYRAAARYINQADVDGVSVQHERGAAESTDGDEPWCGVFVEGSVIGDGD